MIAESIPIELKGDIEISGAQSERQRILELIDLPVGAEYEIDIVGEKITQPALQIFFAMLNEAHERGHVPKLGPRADALDRCRTDAGKEMQRK